MTGRSRGRPRDPQVDDLIMKAALELFVEQGVEGANVERIAKRAGVAKVTIYRRWPSSEALLVQALERARTVVPEERLWAENAGPSDERLMDSWVTTLGDPRYRAVLAQLIGSSTSHPDLLATYREQYLRPRRRLVREALAAGVDPEADVDIDTVIDMVVGAALYRMLVDPGEPSDRDYLAKLVHQANRLLGR
ncbi:hypothetical protein BLA60_35000 [Actinophytocola xinjiangensis]|uniref:HTH tetR-type domain-containing protein n=1 Tax=Actinophytocola xinjiangensis TaxID=485602 RepID=A0A7Z0WEW5_9PSEU|nr:TetR/AcrR family transcriptional regulator [Actinophytocola xinjiangensis]OLF05722.1 hypothetical protein BLA60_35000 [Actinophytocola xinjiangensis]